MSASETTESTALDAVREIASAEFGLAPHEIQPESTIASFENADSVKVLRVVARLERRFGLQLDDEAIFGLQTVGDLLGLLAAATGEASAP